MTDKPKIIMANKLEILKFSSLDGIFEGNIIEPDIGGKELIDKVGWKKGEYGMNKWPEQIWTASRGISKTKAPTIIYKTYNRLSVNETIENIGIGLFIPEGIYLRCKFNESDKYGWLISQSPGAKEFDKKLRRVGL